MIYRIAIFEQVDGVWKFKRYATDEEMLYLRVNAKGKVEQADVDTITPKEFYGWIDVSSTHEVEWGFVWHDGKVFYENDIIARNYGNQKPIVRVVKRQDDPRFALFVARYISGETNSTHDINMHELNVYFNVIGNIHENQELLEVKK